MKVSYPMTPLPLDDAISGNYRRTDPISSVVAGRTCNAEAQRGRILAALMSAGRPMYSAQIAAATGIVTGQVNSRLPVMVRKGLVRRLKDMGENDRGHPVFLWEALPHGVVDVPVGERL